MVRSVKVYANSIDGKSSAANVVRPPSSSSTSTRTPRARGKARRMAATTFSTGCGLLRTSFFFVFLIMWN